MIKNARFRDVPWEQVKPCMNEVNARRGTPEKWDATWRGKEIRVRKAAIQRCNDVSCVGPFYEFDGNPGLVLCGHIVEID